jgi:hypothetical protein
MKVRTTIAAALRARLAVIGYGALTLFALMAISACTSTSSPPVTLSPSDSGSPTVTSSVSAPATTTPTTIPTTTATATITATAAPTPTVTHTVTQAPSPAHSTPAAAPETGGGGTAGFQGGLLFALGAAAIVLGAGTLAFRRLLTRGR